MPKWNPVRNAIRKRVFANVLEHGWHNYRIYGGPTPPWSYSIGFYKTWNAPELVLAGASVYPDMAVSLALDTLGKRISNEPPRPGAVWDVEPLGEVGFRDVHESWKEELLLGDVDFYDGTSFPALQVVPVSGETIDVPDMTRPLDDALPGPWQWLRSPWPYGIPEATHVLTDTLALHGEPITMVNHHGKRKAPTPWDAWACTETEIPDELLCLVPFGTLLATDDTLAETLQIRRGRYAARDYIGDAWRIHDL